MSSLQQIIIIKVLLVHGGHKFVVFFLRKTSKLIINYTIMYSERETKQKASQG